MLRSAATALVLFALWLMMSGVYKPLIVGLGAVSAIFAVYMVRRMDAADEGRRLDLGLNPIAFLGYLGWLLIEIAKANWAVTQVILKSDMGLRQHFFQVPHSQKTDLGQTIFANSITLTPGTISVEVEDDFFWVHAVRYSDDDPEALEEMDRRVSLTEFG